MMDFLITLKHKHSKVTMQAIVEEVRENPHRFEKLMEIVLHGKEDLPRKALWSVSYIVQENHNIILPYYPDVIRLLKDSTKHPAYRRNLVRFLQYVDIPKKYQGEIMEICFRLANDRNESIAVIAFSFTVLYNLYKLYPKIGNELKETILHQLPTGTAGVKGRGRKILKKLG